MMFQLEKINDLFNCSVCQSVIVDPILLPYGETVCKAHTDEISKGKCILCREIHKAPHHGFPSNKIVTNLLEKRVNKISLNFSQFNDYRKIIHDLNKNLKEMETIQNDPENYIFEYFGELTRQVDLRRETLIEDIHKYSDELIQKIEKLKQDCVAKLKEASKITDDLDTINGKMNVLKSTFNSLEIDDTKLEEIMSKKKSKEVSDLMEPVLKQCKYELQGKKYYKLLTNEFKLEDIFGTFSCFDYDIENMKLNIITCLQLTDLNI